MHYNIGTCTFFNLSFFVLYQVSYSASADYFARLYIILTCILIFGFCGLRLRLSL